MLTWYTIATLIVGIDAAICVGFVVLCSKLKQRNKKLTWDVVEIPIDEELGDDAIRLVSNR